MERREGMIQKAVILDEKSMNRAVARISCEIIERNKGAEDLCFIGIMSRGVFIAQRIAERLHETEGLDIPSVLLISPLTVMISELMRISPLFLLM